MKRRIKTPEELGQEIPPTASELWRAWKERSIILTHTQTAILGLERKTDVYNWLYSIGIQPDRYQIKKTNSRYQPYTGSRHDHIEIRFSHSEDLAFIKMSGIIPEQK